MCQRIPIAAQTECSANSFSTAIIFRRPHNSSQAPSSLFIVENNYCICCCKLPVIVRVSCRKTRRSADNFQWHNFFDTDKKSIFKFISRHRSEAEGERTKCQIICSINTHFSTSARTCVAERRTNVASRPEITEKKTIPNQVIHATGRLSRL